MQAAVDSALKENNNFLLSIIYKQMVPYVIYSLSLALHDFLHSQDSWMISLLFFSVSGETPIRQDRQSKHHCESVWVPSLVPSIFHSGRPCRSFWSEKELWFVPETFTLGKFACLFGATLRHATHATLGDLSINCKEIEEGTVFIQYSLSGALGSRIPQAK